jgi:hypothetical protein
LKYETHAQVQWISVAGPGDAFLYQGGWEHILSLRLDPTTMMHLVATVDADNAVHLRKIPPHENKVLLRRRWFSDQHKTGEHQ